MIFVVLAIVFSTTLAVLFKSFTRWGIDTFQAIVVNYFICVFCCIGLSGGWPTMIEISQRLWAPLAALLGLLFIIGFNILAYCVQHIGLIISTLFQKLSLLISALLTIIVFHESIGIIKVLGISLAILSILLLFEKKNSLHSLEHDKKTLVLLFFGVFLMSGVIDFLFFYSKAANLVMGDDFLFIGSSFGIAGVLGTFVIIFSYVKGSMKWSNKNMVAGVLLGLPNVFSVYFILQSIEIGIEGSVLFPVMNVGILLLSALIGIVLFKEVLSKRKKMALALATLSIIIIGFLS